MFKFLHTADIHLDSPLLNLDNYDDAPREEYRSATRRAFDNIVDLAISEDVAFLLIAGDLYDGDCSDFNTPLHFRSRMEDLARKSIRVYIINGNHDAASNMRKAFALTLPENVHVFPTKKPATMMIDELKVAIHGQGFAHREVNDDLSKNYPAAVEGYINIGMLHTNCGSRAGHDPYAPSTVDGLNSLGYDYWALGHIHKPWETGPNPWIIYPGNPQGRHIGETGPRGCVIATCDGHRIDRKQHQVDVMRWEKLEVPLDDCDDTDSVFAQLQRLLTTAVVVAENRPLAVRLEFTGATIVHRELTKQAAWWGAKIREMVLDHFDVGVWIEKIRFQTRDKANRTIELDSAVGELITDLNTPKIAEFARCELTADFDKMLSTIPPDPRLPAVDIDLENETAMTTLVQEAQELLVGRILDTGGEA
jgi:exonuclease SbcD